MKQGFLVMDRCKRDEIMTACASPVTDIYQKNAKQLKNDRNT